MSHVFPHLALVTRFPAFSTEYTFPRAKQWLHVFLHLAHGYTFSRATHRLHVFRAWHQMAPVTRFPALVGNFQVANITCYMYVAFSKITLYLLLEFPWICFLKFPALPPPLQHVSNSTNSNQTLTKFLSSLLFNR